MIERKATADDVRELRAEISADRVTMPNQIDPGTSIDVYDGREWTPGWVLAGCAVRVRGHAGDYYSYKVYQYPRECAVAVTQVRRTKERSSR